MDWAFEGIGTFLIGILLGAGGGSFVTWRVTSRRTSIRQSQRAGDDSTQIQTGRNYKGRDVSR